MSLSQVQTALFTAAVAAIGAIPTEYENVKFTPPVGAKWASLFFLPNVPTVATLGSTGQDEATGLIQIDLNYPLGTGNSAARTDFETIRAAFPAGSRHTSSGQTVMVTGCGRNQGQIVGNYFRVSISVFWNARIPR